VPIDNSHRHFAHMPFDMRQSCRFVGSVTLIRLRSEEEFTAVILQGNEILLNGTKEVSAVEKLWPEGQ
jgi:hypothetical protein